MKKILLILLIGMFLFGCEKEKEKKSLSFDSETLQQLDFGITYIDANENPCFLTDLLNDNQYTFSFWFFPKSAYLNTTLFSAKTKDNYILLSMSENSNGIRNGINLSTSEEKITSSFDSSNYKMNSWNHLVIVNNRNSYSIYLNGTLLAKEKMRVNYLENSEIVLGKTEIHNNPNFEGYFSDVEISNYAKKGEEIKLEYNSDFPAYYLSLWDMEYDNNRVQNLNLPQSFYQEMNIIYSSSNNLIIEDDGTLHLPDKEDGAQKVDFSLIINNNQKEIVKTVSLIVPTDEEICKENSIDVLIQQIGNIVTEKQELPRETFLKESITWRSAEVDIKDYIIYKKNDKEKTFATLTAEIETAEGKKTVNLNVVVLDKYEGYIMAYFNGEEGNEKGKLIYSFDGLHWNEFERTPVISSEMGTGRIRDPFITRNTEGNFMISATQGYDNPEIYLFESSNLIDFTKCRLIKITDQNADLSLSGERAWAPKIFYDALQKHYIIFFSDPKGKNNKGFYYVITKDFENFTYPDLYYDFGYSVIDPIIIQYKTGFLMFYKDEREGAKTIFYATVDNLSKGVKKVYDSQFISFVKNIEGPIVFKKNDENKYFLYADNYPNAKFIAWEFTDINTDLHQLDEFEYVLPENVRHGSVISVTKKELDMLFEYYGKKE